MEYLRKFYEKELQKVNFEINMLLKKRANIMMLFIEQIDDDKKNKFIDFAKKKGYFDIENE